MTSIEKFGVALGMVFILGAVMISPPNMPPREARIIEYVKGMWAHEVDVWNHPTPLSFVCRHVDEETVCQLKFRAPI
jgi:hypothetical protein